MCGALHAGCTQFITPTAGLHRSSSFALTDNGEQPYLQGYGLQSKSSPHAGSTYRRLPLQQTRTPDISRTRRPACCLSPLHPWQHRRCDIAYQRPSAASMYAETMVLQCSCNSRWVVAGGMTYTMEPPYFGEPAAGARVGSQEHVLLMLLHFHVEHRDVMLTQDPHWNTHRSWRVMCRSPWGTSASLTPGT